MGAPRACQHLQRYPGARVLHQRLQKTVVLRAMTKRKTMTIYLPKRTLQAIKDAGESNITSFVRRALHEYLVQQLQLPPLELVAERMQSDEEKKIQAVYIDDHVLNAYDYLSTNLTGNNRSMLMRAAINAALERDKLLKRVVVDAIEAMPEKLQYSDDPSLTKNNNNDMRVFQEMTDRRRERIEQQIEAMLDDD
jgi:hypothetical protein